METVKINIVPKGAVKTAHASQGDAPRVVRFELFDELLPYTLDGSEDITLKVVRPDTEEIVSTVENTEEAYIDVSFTSEMTAIRGVANCEIKISKIGTVIGSHNFDLNIERGAYGEDITVETAQGVIATFTTGVIDNLVGLKTTFEPKQDLHGYETPWIDSNVVNKAPYISRALAGTASRIGNYEFNKLVGGTYAFNQLCEHGNFDSLSGWDKTRGNLSISDNILTYTITEVGSDTNANRIYRDIYKGANHKVLVSFDMLSQVNAFGGIRLVNSQVSKTDIPVSANIWTRISTIFSASGDNENLWLGFGQMNAQIGDEVKVKNVIVIDLTQMFGSTIADYIYSLETAQAGAGVSFFKALFDKDYYPYNAGELMSVKTSAHVTKDASNNVISNIALDPDLELRGIPKLDANNNLYYDGDTYESNGDVTRRLSSVTLDGNLNPNNLNVTVLSDFTQVGYLPYISIGVGGHSRFLCNKNFVFGSSGAGSIYNSGMESAPRMFLGLPASVTTAAEAVAWFANNPTTVLFYIATPTTESADPFTDPQEIDASGSEEFIDARAVSIPVGHESYYANICEIEGIDEINLFHTGKNVIFDKLSQANIRSDGVIISNNDYSLLLARVKSGVAYTLSRAGSVSGSIDVAGYFSDIPDFNSRTVDQSRILDLGNPFTASQDGYLALRIASNTESERQLEKGDQASEYQAYDGESALVEIGQEVYGGYYDKDLGIVLNKKLVDLGSLTWTYNSSFTNPIFYAPLTDKLNDRVNTGLCSHYPILDGNVTGAQNAAAKLDDPELALSINTASYHVFVRDERYSDAASFKAGVTGVKLCYELADPIIIPADAVNFETVKGVNNVWSDTNGETEVKFYVKEA